MGSVVDERFVADGNDVLKACRGERADIDATDGLFMSVGKYLVEFEAGIFIPLDQFPIAVSHCPAVTLRP